MGYPAEGVEGWYRNRREDAKKFLEHRHGQNFWVFNFCPIRENSYDKSIFGGRVSRFPFPDHHAPPLAFMLLVAREMGAWLHGCPERIAVFHCKGILAGKVRSGTMACTYLLSLDNNPSPPKLQRNYSAKERAQLRAEEAMYVVPEGDDTDSGSDYKNADIPDAEDVSATSSHPKKHHSDTLNTVFDLHNSRRMKRSSSPGKKAKQGVSIPSPRRWLSHGALLLSHTAPAHLWAVPPIFSPKVWLTQIKLPLPKNAPELNVLEEWERQTRDENGRMGKRRTDTDHFDEQNIRDLFKDGRRDKKKMVKTFARMGAVGDSATLRERGEGEGDKIDVFTLSLFDIQACNTFRDKLEEKDELSSDDVEGHASSETESLYDITQNPKECVFMGWLWLIPTFHMMPPSEGSTKLRLRRKELDFPLGLGSAIVDVELDIEWLSKEDAQMVQPSARHEQTVRRWIGNYSDTRGDSNFD
ncbi:Phosphatidylinositol-3,4,5-trisphosphate 3-phosphatase cnrN [Termitomyces sp. T112]|nr:Phosphatidylinositol-3,4,5-trisphosphate 3-phosphatase cnrN [Termitomyces sp. T112]